MSWKQAQGKNAQIKKEKAYFNKAKESEQRLASKFPAPKGSKTPYGKSKAIRKVT